MSGYEPPPEAVLIEEARKALPRSLSVSKAAKRAGISEGRWRQIAKGFQQATKETQLPVVAPADTLARMARAVQVSADDLESAGRKDAADILREASHRLGRGLASLIPSGEALGTPVVKNSASGSYGWTGHSVGKSGNAATADTTASWDSLGDTYRDVTINIIETFRGFPSMNADESRELAALEDEVRQVDRLLRPMLSHPEVMIRLVQEVDRILTEAQTVAERYKDRITAVDLELDTHRDDDAPPPIRLADAVRVGEYPNEAVVDNDAPPPIHLADAARTGDSVGRRMRKEWDAQAEAVDELPPDDDDQDVSAHVPGPPE